jgi:anti-sigma factor RsiW
MISPDDPRLTAHADGALPPEEAARFERELAADPAARAELERLRALQRELREVFAEETAEADEPLIAAAPAITPAAAPSAAPRPEPGRVLFFSDWLPTLLAAACIVLVAGAMIIPTVGKVRETSRRSVDYSNLRQIGQASLIFAGDHQDRLPEATDVWDFARQLAIGGGLNDATVWTVAGDPAAKDDHDLTTVLGPDRQSLHPEFAASKPGYAVVVGGLTANSPSTTPLAWTRGLRADGTWSPDSPNGEQGGHVVFLGGNVVFFRNGKPEFIARDGTITRNIFEALPPHARVSEYVPTPAEARAWAAEPRVKPSYRPRHRPLRAWFIAASLAVPLTTLGYQLCVHRIRVVPLALSVVIGILLALIVPTIG